MVTLQILGLEYDLLETIMLVYAMSGACLLPIPCCVCSSAIWTADLEESCATQVRHESITKWLQPRAPAVRSLRLRASGESSAQTAADEERLGPVPLLDFSCMHNFGRQGILECCTETCVTSARHTMMFVCEACLSQRLVEESPRCFC